MSGFVWPVRVYWDDTDGGGVVYYANYLRYLERARTEWLRALGHSQQQLAHDPGIIFTVVALQIEYRRAARLDDALLVSCQPRREGAASFSFVQRIHRASEPAGERVSGVPPAAAHAPGELVASAEVRIACVDAHSFRPQRLPDFLVSALPKAQEPV